MSKLLITVSELKKLVGQQQQPVLIADCRFELTAPNAGLEAFMAGHIPNALYVHLDEVLSSEKTGCNGRHPLPRKVDFLLWIKRAGIAEDTLVVAMDAHGGMFAARLWWLLRWVGHTNVCLLDGGWPAWVAADGEVATGPSGDLSTLTQEAKTGLASMDTYMPAVNLNDVIENVQTRDLQLIDARAPDRFAGDNETLDPIGGHIPNAINRFFKNNLQSDGRFKPADILRKEFESIIGEKSAHEIVHQCGSGVTACHNLFAMELAGLSGSHLYPGSWSEYCSDASRPMWKKG